MDKVQREIAKTNAIIEATGIMVIEIDPSGEVISMPGYLQRACQKKKNLLEIINILANSRYVYEDDKEEFTKKSGKILTKTENFSFVVRLKILNNDYAWSKLAFFYSFDDNKKVNHILCIINNVDDLVKYQKELQFRAEYDKLTGLLNSETFFQKADEKLSKKDTKQYAMIRIDLDKFKYVNDLYGFAEGDKVLQYVANVLLNHIGTKGLSSRVNGDIFAVLYAYKEENDILTFIHDVERRIRIYPLPYTITMSFGVCYVNDRTVKANTILDWAGLALDTIKDSALYTYAFYNNEIRDKQLRESKLIHEMQEALDKREFIVYMQPKYNILTNKMIGAEALVRWLKEDGELIMPGEFIPIFERNGYIIQLDAYVWEETCKCIRNWLDMGKKVVPVSVNVSRSHIYNPNFENTIISLMQKYHLPHKLLELELTESTFVDDSKLLYKRLEELQKKGFVFSMDDFGSGYSSMNMLKEAPVNIIKLDREFLNETVSSEKGIAIIKYTVAMSKQLNMEVIAEGVENEHQVELLKNLGCSYAQGFHFSKPIPTDKLELLLDEEEKEDK